MVDNTKQNLFHLSVQKYVNGALFSRANRLLGCIDHRIPLRFHADKVIYDYANLRSSAIESSQPEIEVRIDPYEGNVAEVELIAEALKPVEEC